MLDRFILPHFSRVEADEGLIRIVSQSDPHFQISPAFTTDELMALIPKGRHAASGSGSDRFWMHFEDGRMVEFSPPCGGGHAVVRIRDCHFDCWPMKHLISVIGHSHEFGTREWHFGWPAEQREHALASLSEIFVLTSRGAFTAEPDGVVWSLSTPWRFDRSSEFGKCVAETNVPGLECDPDPALKARRGPLNEVIKKSFSR